MKEKLSVKNLMLYKREVIIFPVFFVDGLNEFEKIIHNSKTDLH